MDVLKKLFALLSRRERRTLYVLFVGVLVMAALQVLSVASIMPFLSVAADPSAVQDNAYLRWMYRASGLESPRAFLIALGVGAFLMLALANAFILLMRWAMERYAWGRNHSLSRRLLRSYLSRPYEYFLTRNSAELGKNILEEVREVTSNMLTPLLQGTAKGLMGGCVIGFLVYYDPTVALLVALVLGGAYGGIYLVVRTLLDRMGAQRVDANAERHQAVREAFGGIKEVKVQQKEGAFLGQFSGPSRQFAQSQARYRVVRLLPRYAVEAIAFGGIILIAVYLIAVRNSFQQVIPVLGLYAFAGYRLLPALQQAFQGLASARFNLAALDRLDRDLAHTIDAPDRARDGDPSAQRKPLPLTERLSVRDVSFTYPEARQPAVQDLSLDIPAHTITGIVGQTGSGKTTVVDLLLGLLRPQAGRIAVDGTLLTDDRVPRWQRTIGYVPQTIYLADDTVARNIAFGVPEADIDPAAVRAAAQQAQIRAFVEEELPEQWTTRVGEDGVKLSGGQRQRLGIARALYHRPSVLVLDEATSALDPSTETSVLGAMREQADRLTILMVSHRLRTVRRADTIVMLEQGRKVGEGTYDQLLDNHAEFRSMALS